ncbi:hypothetical protein H6768_06795 [Candidatus Peribacteria bacterium]|nr:hypothetical protein [Candidatus Peribacteria bacterium]
MIRLRSQTKKIATDYAYSFDGEENKEEYPDYKSGVFNLGIFPAYRIKNKKIFLSRPLSNILGNAIILSDDCNIEEIIEESKKITISKMEYMIHETGKTYSLYNTLPGKNKISEEVKNTLI